MTTSKWRQRANQVIAQVARDNPDATPDEMRRLLHDAYPFGHRAHHPYKIWLSAVREHLGARRAPDYGTENLPLFDGE